MSWCVLKEHVNEYRAQLQNLDATVCGNAAASASCDNNGGMMSSATSGGYFGSCVPYMGCGYAPGWTCDRQLVENEYPNGCKDGIHPDGAFITYWNHQVPHPAVQNVCRKWWDMLSDDLSCDIRNHATVCTKARVKHVHKMNKNTGMFLLNRVRCDRISGRCFSYKVGKCMTLTTGGNDGKGNYFHSVFNGAESDMEAPTKAWAKAAVKAMKDNVGFTECRGFDHELAEQQMILY